jgi:hypothetical protein
MKVAVIGSSERREKGMAVNVPLEAEEQCTFFEIAQLILTPLQYQLLFAVPNGGKRHIRTAINLKREGVKPGVPDIIFAYPTKQYHGMFIEMKRQKGGVVSEEQKVMIDKLNEVGYYTTVCKGCDEAVREIKGYLGMKDV